MDNYANIFVVEYSVQQEAWHIDNLSTTLERNVLWYLQGEYGNDYKILAIADSHEEAQRILERLRSLKRTTPLER